MSRAGKGIELIGYRPSIADDLKQDAAESLGHPNLHLSGSCCLLSILNTFGSTVFCIECLEMSNTAC